MDTYGYPFAGPMEPWTPLRQVYYEDVEQGMKLPSKSKGPLTVTDMVVFAGASGDFNPIHHDREHARDYEGLPDVILHGQCKLAFLAQVVTDWIGVEGRIKKLGAQYRGMDIVGDTVVSRGRVIRKYTEAGESLVDLELWNENGRVGTTVVGTAIVSLPSRSPGK